ncbi:MAG: aldose 1-epimerase [Spirochaetaceae bacterium]
MITKELIDGQEAITLTVGNNSITIIKSLGATVYKLKLNNRDILFPDPITELTKNELFRGRILFPFNDRIPNGTYSFNNKNYQFPLNCDGKDSIHGLIYNRDMDVVENKSLDSKDILQLQTKISKNDFTGYPFDIAISITFTLTEESINIDFLINNSGDKEAPYALGWHPYFTFGKDIGTSNLTFEGKEYFDVDANLYYEGNHYPIDGTELDYSKGKNINSSELDIAISLKDKGKFLLKDGKDNINAEFSSSLFPNLQLFVPDDRKSIAIEPISAPSDTFNYPDTGLKILKPGEEDRGYVKLFLS